LRSLLARLRQNHGIAIAYLALFVALGGVSVAAINLPAKSVGTKQLKANAVVSSKVKDGSLLRKDFGASELPAGAVGPSGATGAAGTTGPTGTTGAAGPVAFAEFYALMPPDNAATVAAGGAVDFPQNGPAAGGIARTGVDTFQLQEIGTYRVAFAVSVSEPGQLQLSLDSGAGAVPLAATVYGRATGTSQITGESLVTTTVKNAVLSVINPTGNPTDLTITPLAGGTKPAAATLVIERLS
jgi:hypothetical protein